MDGFSSSLFLAEPVAPPEPPAIKDLLQSDETVINPYYMRQLLAYGIKLGQSHSDMDQDSLLRESEVRHILASTHSSFTDAYNFYSVWWLNSKRSNSEHKMLKSRIHPFFGRHSPCSSLSEFIIIIVCLFRRANFSRSTTIAVSVLEKSSSRTII